MICCVAGIDDFGMIFVWNLSGWLVIYIYIYILARDWYVW